FIRTALHHGVMPLVYRSLDTACPDAVPKTVMDQLRDHFNANALNNFLLTEELLELLNLFESQRVRAIPYKGPALATSVYGNLLLRQFVDLDILVRERDYLRTQHLLISQGFRLTIEHEWEAEFTDKKGRVAVDLHKRMRSQEFHAPLNFDYVSKRLQSIDL